MAVLYFQDYVNYRSVLHGWWGHANGADYVSSKVQRLSPLPKRNQKLLVKWSLSEQSLRTKTSTQHEIMSSGQSLASVLSRE